MYSTLNTQARTSPATFIKNRISRLKNVDLKNFSILIFYFLQKIIFGLNFFKFVLKIVLKIFVAFKNFLVTLNKYILFPAQIYFSPIKYS